MSETRTPDPPAERYPGQWQPCAVCGGVSETGQWVLADKTTRCDDHYLGPRDGAEKEK